MKNIKKIKKDWVGNMNVLMNNVNLSEICIAQGDCIIFCFLNSSNGKIYKKLICKQVFKYSIENAINEGGDFSYFIPDVYIRELIKDEIDNTFLYYKYGFYYDINKINKLYLILICGAEISIDVICADYNFE